MTFEELKATPMKYVFGYSAEDHGLRQYVSDDGLIAKQVYTPRNPKTLIWGDGKTTFMLTDTKEEFDTAQDLLNAINARNDK
jgi:hypothetical protein